jgi:hypothetical protein
MHRTIFSRHEQQRVGSGPLLYRNHKRHSHAVTKPSGSARAHSSPEIIRRCIRPLFPARRNLALVEFCDLTDESAIRVTSRSTRFRSAPTHLLRCRCVVCALVVPDPDKSREAQRDTPRVDLRSLSVSSHHIRTSFSGHDSL